MIRLQRKSFIKALFHHLQAVIDGPRATDRFAAVTAAAVAGLAAEAKAGEIIAEFLSALAARLEQVWPKPFYFKSWYLTRVLGVISSALQH